MFSFWTTTGEGRAIVHVYFSVDYEGDITLESVELEHTDIKNAISEVQFETLQEECSKYLKDEHNNDLYDRGQQLYEERQAA